MEHRSEMDQSKNIDQNIRIPDFSLWIKWPHDFLSQELPKWPHGFASKHV